MIQERVEQTRHEQWTHQPVFFDPAKPGDKDAMLALVRQDPQIKVYDELLGQLRELAKIQHPARPLTPAESDAAIARLLDGTAPEDYGRWVYYPWAGKLVHILGKEAFIALRTARNMHKIKAEEREQLGSKKIGIIGLSVGQAIAVTMAMERIGGELRLADFDTVELSNMNRLRTSLFNLGMPKVILAAREIAELDPYLEVKVFTDGITEGNIDAFLTEGGKLDILVEECDGVDVKILSRKRAKALQIPVVMDTNDRGMLDIERYDLHPDYPLLHGLIPDIADLSTLKHLTNEEKIPILGPMAGIAHMSPRMKYSLGEVGKSITTWPQLASSVMLGGAMVADTCRRILLGDLRSSGRYYVDFDELIQ
ncbi:ThiF family adenylyltransferase [Chitinophaga lutea]